eukprot:CAMPEP_0183521128 /NCGR_PEP_ID=MMETSP0371-20130417/17444_1 /TAXON_ID=268820 /ORGANISM="Peridinium aciculiferum, Strain PAER-2" /LENGTH=63 /DNA_ID=CAMNT_0025719621 /DNA_START=1 /DNA_END=189 /DNA_ORIENTATION=+
MNATIAKLEGQLTVRANEDHTIAQTVDELHDKLTRDRAIAQQTIHDMNATIAKLEGQLTVRAN